MFKFSQLEQNLRYNCRVVVLWCFVCARSDASTCTLHCVIGLFSCVRSGHSDIEPKARVLRGSIFDLSAVSTTNIQAHWPACILVWLTLFTHPTFSSTSPSDKSPTNLVSRETIELILWDSFTSLRTAFNTNMKNKTLKINFKVFYYILMWTVKGFFVVFDRDSASLQ